MYLCLDFDGVIADGIDECLVVSWLAWHNKTIPECPQNLLDSIPAKFRQEFNRLRSYVRHDEHFMAPFAISTSNQLRSQRDFDSVFSTLDDDLIKQFTTKFQKTRMKLRHIHPDEWLAFHTLYAGIQSLFMAGHTIFIVSGKDTESIHEICKTNNIQIEKNKIFGGLKSKTEVLQTLFTQSKINKVRMIFCDDNLPNVISSKALGIKTYWARWGYHTEEHLEIAKNKSIDSASLDLFLSIARGDQLQ